MGGPVPPVLWGCKPAAKKKNKVRPAVDNGPWDRLKKKRPKSGLNDPELIEQKPSKTYGFWVLVLSHTRDMYPLR